jgi:hypothetical protein
MENNLEEQERKKMPEKYGIIIEKGNTYGPTFKRSGEFMDGLMLLMKRLKIIDGVTRLFSIKRGVM